MPLRSTLGFYEAAVGGKDAVYAGCELEPMEWSATRTVIIG